MIKQFIDDIALALGISHKDVVLILVPISIFLAGIITNTVIKGISNHNQRVLNRKLFKINLRRLIIAVNRQGRSYKKLSPQLSIKHSGEFTFNPISISAITIFKNIKYEELYKAFFSGTINYLAFDKKKRLIAFSQFYGVLEYLSQYHRPSLEEIQDFERRGNDYQNLLNDSLGKVSDIMENFGFDMHETPSINQQLTNYFHSVESIKENYQSKNDYNHPINTELNLVQKLLDLNRSSISTLKLYHDKSYSVSFNSALLEASNRFENLKLFKDAYSQRYENYADGFLTQANELIKVYLYLLSPRFCKIKTRK